MKNVHQDFHDLSEAKDLLQQVEGGLSPIPFPGDDFYEPVPFPFPGDKCDWYVCVQPLYGTIIDYPKIR
ncbi:hypothetical protein [Pseudoalteromonas phenolica]|uniref:hypothetical protein n=1 Tax=Pseudoalteromonas phenolica TaxID=161398 RepID=UPI00110BB11D|nr:hypothetical protein [Pseudoalteromonas phenolica]TMO54342.1 hypothetical protein CWC21_15500 [Pseudoalteromonas phenolica]